ncbi:MAG: acyl-CoA/acyl-ACP dehydrogenase, partial [Chloroflexi bacterium]|nr:acyl-CoA/acyl-ACP dehydrogenase [Chloroflexota bacterium]
MDLSFSAEQDTFRATLREFMAKECDRMAVRDWEESELGYSADVWRKMGELGWLGIVFPKKYGGQGSAWLDLVVLMEELGANPCPTPYQTGVLQSGLALLELGSEKQKKTYLPKILSGDLRFSLCLTEPSASYDPWGLQVRGMTRGEHWVLNGTKLFIQYAASADYYLVVARTRDADDDADGLSLFLVDANTEGIGKTPLISISDDKQCELVFNQVLVPRENLVGTLHNAWPALRKVMTLSTIALSAEMAGGTQAALNYAVDYAKFRVQFGRPIGSFQAIQHYAADMLIASEAARFSAYEAAWRVDEGMPYEMETSAAKAICSEAYTKVTAKGHQILGGVGIYKEMDMQLWYRRAKAME